MRAAAAALPGFGDGDFMDESAGDASVRDDGRWLLGGEEPRRPVEDLSGDVRPFSGEARPFSGDARPFSGDARPFSGEARLLSAEVPAPVGGLEAEEVLGDDFAPALFAAAEVVEELDGPAAEPAAAGASAPFLLLVLRLKSDVRRELPTPFFVSFFASDPELDPAADFSDAGFRRRNPATPPDLDLVLASALSAGTVDAVCVDEADAVDGALPAEPGAVLSRAPMLPFPAAAAVVDFVSFSLSLVGAADDFCDDLAVGVALFGGFSFVVTFVGELVGIVEPAGSRGDGG